MPIAVMWYRKCTLVKVSRTRAHAQAFFDSDIRFLRFGLFCWYGGLVWRRISGLAGWSSRKRRSGKYGRYGGWRRQRTRAHTRREFTDETVFSHTAGDSLPTYPPTGTPHPHAFGAHASAAVGAFPPSEHIYMCQPSTYHTTYTRTYTRARCTNSYDTHRHACTGHYNLPLITRPTIPNCVKICHI